MQRDDIIKFLVENQCMLADGWEDCIIGVSDPTSEPRAIYDIRLMAKKLIERDGMDEDVAYEFLDFNVLTSCRGDNCPIFAHMCDE